MTESPPDRKRIVLQQERTDANQQAFEVYHLSHDLRGPLNSILGFTELLLEEIEGSLNEVQKEDISAINQSAQNLLRLINNMVDLSKLDAGRLEFNFEVVYLKQIINGLSISDVWTGRPDQVELVVDLPETLPLLWGDSSRVEQMVMGLLSLALRLKRAGEVVITADYDAKTVTIQIHLPEVVVSAQELEEFFKLMVKVDATGRSELGSGGLEFPLVRRLAEKHKGRVWAESEEGAGTTFYLSVPVYDETGQSSMSLS